MDDTPNPANDAAPLPAPRTDSSTPRGGARAGLYGFLGGLLAGIVIAGIVVAGAVIEWPALRASLMPDADDPVLVALDRRIAAVEATTSKPPAQDPAIGKLAQRLDTLEQAQRAPAADPRVAALADKVDQLTTQIGALRSTEANPADLESFAKRAEAAAETAKDAAGRRQSVEALLLVVGELRDAIGRGGPYRSELDAARAVAPPDAGPALDALAAAADTGMGSRTSVTDAFPMVARAIVDAAAQPSESAGFWEKLERKASALVSIRRIDGQGDDAASIVARAETAAKQGDLAQAVHELAALSGPAADAAKPWIAKAQAWIGAEQALSDLTAKSAAAAAARAG